MAKIVLAGGASTQSRARRPLPAGARRARTLYSRGVEEQVEFLYSDTLETRTLLTWVVGQAGLLWGGLEVDDPQYPPEILSALRTEFYDADIPGSYGHAAEYDLAEVLGEIYDGLLSSDDLAVRFFQNASDACAAAARVCRAALTCEMIATFGYHGSHADFAHDPVSAGVPRAMVHAHLRFEWGDAGSLREAAYRVAMVMVEVPPVPDDEARAFLKICREFCDECDIPFVLDDTVLGFRLALGGSAEYYGVKPDIVILGKAMSATGGVAAVLGRRDLVGRLADDVFYSTTFGGSPGPCAVANATVWWLKEHRQEVYGPEGHLRKIGQALKDGFNALGIPCVGQPERSIFQFPTDAEWLVFCSRMIEQGVMVHRPNYPTLVHTMQDVEKTLEAAGKVMAGEIAGATPSDAGRTARSHA